MFVDVVWFKRDLRVTDHQPLIEAATSPFLLPVYVAEPEVLGHATTSPRHVAFIRESLADLCGALQALGSDLMILDGAAVAAFELVRDELAAHGLVLARLLAHRETGNWVTYQRDEAVRAWAKQNRVEFLEFVQSGVQRPIGSRDGWSQRRKRWLAKAPLAAPVSLPGLPPGFAGASAGAGFAGEGGRAAAAGFAGGGAIAATALLNPPPEHELTERQTGGRHAALARLADFFEDTPESPARVRGYEKKLSSPVTGVDGCSRLSAYLTYGCLTAREVHHYIAAIGGDSAGAAGANGGAAAGAAIGGAGDPVQPHLPKRSIAAFEQRMAWRDHFTQKLEDEPELEWRAYHPALDAFRGDGSALSDEQQELLDAWVNARTGFAMVDAVVNQLRQTGWTTFRMRAMVVSFASYDLWLPWQVTGAVLARWFTDYEPGIHWPQMQMQSGVTGTNTMRIYDPVKQARDHDATGEFVGRYAGGGGGVAGGGLSGGGVGVGSPVHPIVDHKVRTGAARAALSEVRRRLRAEGVLDQILAKHGSRRPAPNRRRPTRTRAPVSGQ